MTDDERRSVVFGGLDGLITILAIISGAAGIPFPLYLPAKAVFQKFEYLLTYCQSNRRW